MQCADNGERTMYRLQFPDVNFSDKIAVYFADGSIQTFKHLYFDNTALDEIDWDQVVDCHDI